MNFQQLRYVRETVRQNLNLTEAANKLFTSQPGVSKQIRELEDELGVEIFVRRGKRIVALTDPGRAVVKIIERLLVDSENLKQVGREFKDQQSGTLVVATTHTQARYALPRMVPEFKKRFPKVRLMLSQGAPPHLADMVIAGEADIAIATEALDQYPQLLAMPGYSWHHSIVVPAKHPLLKLERVTLQDLAQYPLVTYDTAFTGRSHIDAAFASANIAVDIVLTAIDADVIKTYVELGLGVGIVASMAYEKERDKTLRAIDAGHLFRSSTTRVAIRRGGFMRGFAYAFVELFAPQLTKSVIDKAMAGEAEQYDM